MSQTGGHCTEVRTSKDSLIDSVVTDTTTDSGDHVTPKILCGLQGLAQKKSSDVLSPRWKAKLAPSSASTSTGISSPQVPFQMVNKVDIEEACDMNKQESCSEPMSPSILPQVDRWTESFSVIPSFLRKQVHNSQPMESQSQSLLPQADKRTENLISTRSSARVSGTLTRSSAVSKSETDTTAGSTKLPCKKSKTGKSTKKKSPPTLTEISEGVLKKKSSKLTKPSSLKIPPPSTTNTSELKDVTAKVKDTIEKLLADMEKGCRKEMLVKEAAVVHCVSSIQDNIEKKLIKLKPCYSTETADIQRNLLQSLKPTLGRLIEHQKQEREKFAVTSALQASQMSQGEMIIQKTMLLELGKRQKQVFSLFTRQRELATKLMEIEKMNGDVNEENDSKTGLIVSKKDISRTELIQDKIADVNHENDVNRFFTCTNEILDETTRKNVGKSEEMVNAEAKKVVTRSTSDRKQCIEEVKKKCVNDADKLLHKADLSVFSTVVGPIAKKLDSELLDVLKILGPRKRQNTMNELANADNTQVSCSGTLADQHSFKDNDMTPDLSIDTDNFIDISYKADDSFERSQVNTSVVNVRVVKSADNEGKIKLKQTAEVCSMNPISIEDMECNVEDIEKLVVEENNGKTIHTTTDHLDELTANSEKNEEYTKANNEKVSSGENLDYNVQAKELNTEKVNDKFESADLKRKSKVLCNQISTFSIIEARNIKKQLSRMKKKNDKDETANITSPDKTKKKSLSDYNPSSGGIDPRSIYKQVFKTKTSSSEAVADNNKPGGMSPKTIEPKAFYKLDKNELKDTSSRGDALHGDLAGCVAVGEDEVPLSQDVTTIPDTQEPGTQETVTRSIPTDGQTSAHSQERRTKRKRGTSSDETVSRRKKYTKMQKTTTEKEFSGADNNSKVKDEIFRLSTDDDQTKKTMLNTDVSQFHKQNVTKVVPLNNSVSCVETGKIIANEKELDGENDFNESERNTYSKSSKNSTCGEDSLDLNGFSNQASSEKLSDDMKKKETIHLQTASRPDSDTVFNETYKQTEIQILRSPGDKLDRVIQRITKEKEIKSMLKGSFKGSSNCHSFNKPDSDESLKVTETGNHFFKCSEIKDVRKVDENHSNLHQAGLAVEISLPSGEITQLHQKSGKIVSHVPQSDSPLLFSPPRELPDELYTDVSPTATSMSSDVFQVKAKELEKRMKLRAEMTQKLVNQSENQSTSVGTAAKISVWPKVGTGSKPDTLENNKTKFSDHAGIQNSVENGENKIRSILEQIKIDQVSNDLHQKATLTVEGDQRTMSKTSEEKLEAVINDVIKSSATFSNKNDYLETQNNSSSQNLLSLKTGVFKYAQTSVKRNKPKCLVPRKPISSRNLAQPVEDETQIPGQRTQTCLPIEPNATDRQQGSSQDTAGDSQTFLSADINGNMTPDAASSRPVLPTLKTMLQNGVLKPGVSVLSAHVEGQIHHASLTPQGLIRSAEGKIFKTPMQWLMLLLGDGSVIRRQNSYEMITYMGHTLLSYCSKTPELKQVIKELRIEHQERSVKERSIWEDPKEAYLTEILSNCRIRLLCRDDLVPCHDLPYNFWANDFADVKVPSDIWECVDKWN